MATIASEAWDKMSAELACVDDEYLKRAFLIVWLARGTADKAAFNDSEADKRVGALDQVFWD